MINYQIQITRNDGLKISLTGNEPTYEKAMTEAYTKITAYLGYGYKIRYVRTRFQEVPDRKRCGGCELWDHKNSLPTCFTKPQQTKARCLNDNLPCYKEWKLETDGERCAGHKQMEEL